MTALSTLWADIWTPSAPDEPPYARMVISLAHAVLGAAGAVLLPAWAVLALYLVKEVLDLRRGGSWRDGAWDTAAVALGTFYGPAWWPVAALALALANAISPMRDR